MFGLGLMEIVIILVVALLVFGPAKLPELARSLGRGLAEFRRAGAEVRSSILAPSETREDAPPQGPAEQMVSAPLPPETPRAGGAGETGATPQAGSQAEAGDAAQTSAQARLSAENIPTRAPQGTPARDADAHTRAPAATPKPGGRGGASGETR